MSETEVIDSMLPSVAPFRRDRTSNKARLMTLFNNGCTRLSLLSHHFTSSSKSLLNYCFSLISVAPNSHTNIVTHCLAKIFTPLYFIGLWCKMEQDKVVYYACEVEGKR